MYFHSLWKIGWGYFCSTHYRPRWPCGSTSVAQNWFLSVRALRRWTWSLSHRVQVGGELYEYYLKHHWAFSRIPALEADLTKIMEEGHSFVALDQDHIEVRTLFRLRVQTEEIDRLSFPRAGNLRQRLWYSNSLCWNPSTNPLSQHAKDVVLHSFRIVVLFTWDPRINVLQAVTRANNWPR